MFVSELLLQNSFFSGPPWLISWLSVLKSHRGATRQQRSGNSLSFFFQRNTKYDTVIVVLFFFTPEQNISLCATPGKAEAVSMMCVCVIINEATSCCAVFLCSYTHEDQ